MTRILTLMMYALSAALATSGCALDDAADVGHDETELTLSGNDFGWTLSRPTPDRMVWIRTNGAAEADYWKLSDLGGVESHNTMTNTTGMRAVGAAGDRVLWTNAFSGATELRTIDPQTGAVTASHTLPPLNGYLPVSISLASPLAWNCYERGAEQDYYVAYNGNDGTYAVRLVAGDGYVRRTTFSDKPLQYLNVQLIWFGYGADGYLWAMFRGLSTAYRYRAQWAQTHYTHNTPRITSLAGGYVPMGMTAKPHPKLVLTYAFQGGTSWNDHILYANTSTGEARLAAFNMYGDAITSAFNGGDVVWQFANPSHAGVNYTYVPPMCN